MQVSRLDSTAHAAGDYAPSETPVTHTGSLHYATGIDAKFAGPGQHTLTSSNVLAALGAQDLNPNEMVQDVFSQRPDLAGGSL
jgi:hypothetical protein